MFGNNICINFSQFWKNLHCTLIMLKGSIVTHFACLTIIGSEMHSFSYWSNYFNKIWFRSPSKIIAWGQMNLHELVFLWQLVAELLTARCFLASNGSGSSFSTPWTVSDPWKCRIISNIIHQFQRHTLSHINQCCQLLIYYLAKYVLNSK